MSEKGLLPKAEEGGTENNLHPAQVVVWAHTINGILKLVSRISYARFPLLFKAIIPL